MPDLVASAPDGVRSMAGSPSSREVIALLIADGWVHVATRGDHWQFKHSGKPGRVTLPHPRKDIPTGTLRSIHRQAGLDWTDRRT